MAALDPGGLHTLIETAVTAVSVLGGAMAYASGFAAAQGVAAGDSPQQLSARINEALAKGFVYGGPLSALALIIEGWT
jgi:hypothetical protein